MPGNIFYILVDKTVFRTLNLEKYVKRIPVFRQKAEKRGISL